MGSRATRERARLTKGPGEGAMPDLDDRLALSNATSPMVLQVVHLLPSKVTRRACYNGSVEVLTGEGPSLQVSYQCPGG